ncbi:hypothetical protein DXG01_016122 [Tephrocybe rancida]|nr:hypothetical protein DXG01_016122 [Tephrocybe rancida]
MVAGSWNFWAYWHLKANNLNSQLPTVIAFYVLSLAANATSTFLLAYRIHTVRKMSNEIQPSTYTTADGGQAVRPGRRSLKPVLIMILESGALNAAYLLVITITLLTGSQGFLIMDAMVSLNSLARALKS